MDEIGKMCSEIAEYVRKEDEILELRSSRIEELQEIRSASGRIAQELMNLITSSDLRALVAIASEDKDTVARFGASQTATYFRDLTPSVCWEIFLWMRESGRRQVPTAHTHVLQTLDQYKKRADLFRTLDLTTRFCRLCTVESPECSGDTFCITVTGAIGDVARWCVLGLRDHNQPSRVLEFLQIEEKEEEAE